MKLQVKRGLRSQLPILAEGELGLTTDEKRLYIGANGGNQKLADAAEMEASLSNKANKTEFAYYPEDGNLNDITVASQWIVYMTATNSPPLSAYWIVLNTYVNTTGAVVQDAVSASENKRAYRMRYDTTTWTDWTIIATTTPPQAYDLPLAEGMTAHGETTYRKTQEGIVILNIAINRNAVEIVNSSPIATLPVGFRPKHIVCFGASLQGSVSQESCAVSIATDGVVRMFASDNEWVRLFTSVVYQI